MSTNHTPPPAGDETWLQRVNEALQAVKALHQSVSQENGDTARVTRMLRRLKQARAVWLAGDRARAEQLLAAAMTPDDEPVDAKDAAAALAPLNGQAGERRAAGPTARKAAPEHT
jgi:hypothetical protein